MSVIDSEEVAKATTQFVLMQMETVEVPWGKEGEEDVLKMLFTAIFHGVMWSLCGVSGSSNSAAIFALDRVADFLQHTAAAADAMHAQIAATHGESTGESSECD